LSPTIYFSIYRNKKKKNVELKTILDLFPELDISIANNIPYIKAKTEELANTTYNKLKNRDIIALKQHGIVCIGKTFQKVMEIIETLEYYCKIALLEK